jgi:acetyltransferase-like isoleucine patch superfamily enzyme
VHKRLFRRITNRVFHVLARNVPGSTSLRPWLHRRRGVKIGRDVFIGDGVYLDNEYPECIEIGDNVEISIRAIVVAHTRGAGRVIIEEEAFIGPNAMVLCGGGRVLRIGAGAVVGAGAVITKSVPQRLYVAPPPSEPMARVRVPLPKARTMTEFWAGLETLPKRPSDDRPRDTTRA